ncbi:L,D-transpeptidase [Mycobacterium sp. RTGN5]|uniref:L,D-transpeptidase n=1 Tax=Mycobacterium sp. RTGN5 TaxID=3016522 RepID=UPI0029C995B4|nr:L,D-transpeptidase [Mycobacterium sp. RTGN5]
MKLQVKGAIAATLCVVGVAAGISLGSGSALADPDQSPADPGIVDVPPAQLPPPPDPFAPPPADPAAFPQGDPALPPPPPPADPFAPPPPPPADPLAAQQAAAAAAGPVKGQNPLPYTGDPVFAPPTFNPVNGSMVGVGKPIMINFARPIANRALAESAIHISSVPPVPGAFYWTTDSQVRWRPYAFWPTGTVVNIDASGARSSFRVGDTLVATVDDKTHQMTVTKNGAVLKTFPVSMGKPDGKHETKNGTYYVLEKFPDIIMDSATYGVPNTSPEGYKLKVQWAVRIDNSGAFVHSAPWSVADQGKRNVSHGCINLAPDNAKWFYDNFGSGDPIVIKNSVGTYNNPDGADDWQWQLA